MSIASLFQTNSNLVSFLLFPTGKNKIPQIESIPIPRPSTLFPPTHPLRSVHPLLPFTVTPLVGSRVDSSPFWLYPILFWAAGGNIPIIHRWLVVVCRGQTCCRRFLRASGVVVSCGQAMGTHGCLVLMRQNVRRLLKGAGRVISKEPTPKKKLLLTRRSDAAAGQWLFC